MKILLTNDDGVNAEGLKSLYKYLNLNFPDFEIKVCAPLTERSSTGHHFSLHNPLWLESIDDNIYGCSGFPADCTYLGLHALYKETDLPDLVISGINRGGNLAQDIYYSGTLAAAREASLGGVPAIGVSLCTEFDFGHVKYLFETAAKVIGKLIEKRIHKKIPKDHLINLNIPNLSFEELKGLKLTELGRRNYAGEVEKRYDPRGGEYWWHKASYEGVEPREGTDCGAIVDGFASLSLLNVFPQTSDKKASLQEIAKAF